MKLNDKLAEASEAEVDGFKLEEFLPYQLSVTANRLARLFGKRYAEEHGLSIPEWRVLAVVGRFGTVSPSTVSEWATMDKVKVSRAAATLVARGLLKQSQDPTDGRARLLRLTRKGTNVHQEIIPLAQELEAKVAEGLTRAEWTALQKALVRLTTHIESLGIGAGPDPDE